LICLIKWRVGGHCGFNLRKRKTVIVASYTEQFEERKKTRMTPIQYRISSDLNSIFFLRRRQATAENAWKNGSNLKKNGSHLEKWLSLGKVGHLKKRVPLGATLWKMRHTWRNAAHLEKTRHSWKNAPHLEKCGKVGKMRHTWKSAAKLEKCATLGKMRHS